MSAFRVGVAGPVGSGKTALVDALCKATVMEHDAKKMRGDKPFVFTNLKNQEGLEAVVKFVILNLV